MFFGERNKGEVTNSSFQYKNPEHTSYILAQIIKFKKASEALHKNDEFFRYSFGGTLASICFINSICLSTVGFLVTLCFTHSRAELQTRYNDEWSNLLKTFKWCLNDTSSSKLNETLTHPSVQQLILTFGPYIGKEIYSNWDMEKIDPTKLTREFVNQLEAFATGKHTKSWYFNLYGNGGKKGLEVLLEIPVTPIIDSRHKVLEYWDKASQPNSSFSMNPNS